MAAITITIAVPIFTARGTTRSDQATVQIQRLSPDNLLDFSQRPLEDGRIQCEVCPRLCKLHEGQRGLCFVRARHNDQIVLTT